MTIKNMPFTLLTWHIDSWRLYPYFREDLDTGDPEIWEEWPYWSFKEWDDAVDKAFSLQADGKLGYGVRLGKDAIY